MEKQWAGTTYGNGWMHKWLIRMLRYIPIEVLYAFVAVFVIPVCLIINPATGLTYRYFRERWQYSPLKSALKTYRNFLLFGEVVVDRFAMYAGKHFDFHVEGYVHYQKLAEREEGFVQLSAHIGNYELAGYTLRAEKKRFNALVFGGEKESVMQNRNRMFADTHIRMIPIKEDMSHMYDINNALADGEIVSMPGDRMIGSKKDIAIPLLGAVCHLPQGPFSIATMRRLDCLAVNVMKTSRKGYTIYATPLHYDKTTARETQERQLAQSYIDELERILTMYPEQWYNYFEYWDDIHLLLPQQEPYVLIDRLMRFEKNKVVTKSSVSALNTVGGLLENIAQTSSARIGFINRYILHRDVSAGMLAAVPEMKIYALPKAGDTITTTLEVTAEVFDMCMAKAEVRRGDELLATAELKFKN